MVEFAETAMRKMWPGRRVENWKLEAARESLIASQIESARKVERPLRVCASEDTRPILNCSIWLSRQRIVGVTAMSDRYLVATTMLIAGIMLGAFTVQLKDQISLHLGTLGFEAIMKCSATGP